MIDNHTCNVLEQISNLLLSVKVNTDLSSNWEKIENSIYWGKYFAKTVEDGWMCWLFGTFLLQNQLRPLRDWRFLFSPQLSKGKVFVHFFKLQAVHLLIFSRKDQLKTNLSIIPVIDQKFQKAERVRSQIFFVKRGNCKTFAVSALPDLIRIQEASVPFLGNGSDANKGPVTSWKPEITSRSSGRPSFLLHSTVLLYQGLRLRHCC